MFGHSDRHLGKSTSMQRGNRGRGSIRGQWQSGAGTRAETSLTNKEQAGKLLLTIHPGFEKTTSGINLTIEECKYVASYNWLDGKGSTILVPGSPPTWTPPARPVKLREDNGTYYRDINAAHYSAYPLEPAIRALLKVNPNYESPEVDIVGCGNTLGSLLSACCLSDDRTFSFGVERIGNTVFLVRQTPAEEVIENVYGYGHSLPEAYTTWPRDVKGSASHQRLIEYKFAGLRCIVRSESDGYLTEKVIPRNLTDGGKRRVVGELSLEEATDTLAVSYLRASVSADATSSKLIVRSAGQSIPQRAIFDLKTRSIRRKVDTDDFLPRLWVNQTPNFIIARHDSGVFNEIEVKDVKSDVQRWETANRDVLLRLYRVLNELIKLTSRDGSSRVQVRREGTGPLLVSEPTKKWTVLPPDLKARWQGKKTSEANVPNDNTDDTDSEDETEDYLKF